MQLDRDFRESLECLAAREVRFLVVGGYAVAAHGHPRYTGDLDLWVWPAVQNAESLLTALGDVTEPGRVVQLGDPPLRIDLLTSIDGVEFETCFDRRVEIVVDGLPVPFIALDDLAPEQGRQRAPAGHRGPRCAGP